MNEHVLLEVPESIANHAREVAQQTGRSFEDVLTEWLERGAASESIYPLRTDVHYEVWSPYDSAEAAATLTRILEEHNEHWQRK